MILVINEWIFHDLLGENGLEAYAEADRFIRKLFQSDDWIVMPSEQRWKSKAYQLMTSPHPQPETGQPTVSPAIEGLEQVHHRQPQRHSGDAGRRV